MFADIDPGRQLELSRQAQSRQQNFGLAVKKMNEVRLEAGTAAGGIFPIMKAFGDITGESGGDVVSFSDSVDGFGVTNALVVNRTTSRFLEITGTNNW
jgi:hypothetical protein